jgi:hypothetical protein
VFFEVRLRRFAVWQTAVGVVAALAVAAVAAWAVAMFDAQSPAARAFVVGFATVLAAATIAAALSLARVQGGVLALREGAWTFTPNVGPLRSGALEVAIDFGAFLLLRLGTRRRTSVWLPVQRRGLEAEWHALRCAVYSPPPAAAGAPTASSLSAE